MPLTVDIIDQKFLDHKDYLKLQFETVNAAIKEVKDRVDKTNGRVKKLELWKATLLGAWIIITMLIVPIFITYAKDFLFPEKSYSQLVLK
jgi:hypothetical protein